MIILINADLIRYISGFIAIYIDLNTCVICPYLFCFISMIYCTLNQLLEFNISLCLIFLFY